MNAYRVEERLTGGWASVGIYQTRKEAAGYVASHYRRDHGMPETRIVRAAVPQGYSCYQGQLWRDADLDALAKEYATE